MIVLSPSNPFLYLSPGPSLFPCPTFQNQTNKQIPSRHQKPTNEAQTPGFIANHGDPSRRNCLIKKEFKPKSIYHVYCSISTQSNKCILTHWTSDKCIPSRPQYSATRYTFIGPTKAMIQGNEAWYVNRNVTTQYRPNTSKKTWPVALVTGFGLGLLQPSLLHIYVITTNSSLITIRHFSTKTFRSLVWIEKWTLNMYITIKLRIYLEDKFLPITSHAQKQELSLGMLSPLLLTKSNVPLGSFVSRIERNPTPKVQKIAARPLKTFVTPNRKPAGPRLNLPLKLRSLHPQEQANKQTNKHAFRPTLRGWEDLFRKNFPFLRSIVFHSSSLVLSIPNLNKEQVQFSITCDPNYNPETRSESTNLNNSLSHLFTPRCPVLVGGFNPELSLP